MYINNLFIIIRPNDLLYTGMSSDNNILYKNGNKLHTALLVIEQIKIDQSRQIDIINTATDPKVIKTSLIF